MTSTPRGGTDPNRQIAATELASSSSSSNNPTPLNGTNGLVVALEATVSPSLPSHPLPAFEGRGLSSSDGAAATLSADTVVSTATTRFGDLWRALTGGGGGDGGPGHPKPENLNPDDGTATCQGGSAWCCPHQGLRLCRTGDNPTTTTTTTTPRALCLATITCVGTFAAFCASLVLLLLSLQRHQLQESTELTGSGGLRGNTTTNNNNDPSSLVSVVNYTAAQERWVYLRDQLNLTLLSAETPQSQALRYLALHDSWHNLPQQYALAVVYYTWDGPWWASASSAVVGQDDATWMPVLPMMAPTESETASSSSAGAEKPRECQWFGVKCDVDGSITSLNLTDSGRFAFAQGVLPSELGLLSRLQHLIVPEHGLQGSVPTELAQLTELRELDLRYNQLTSMATFVRETARQATTTTGGSKGSRLERVKFGFNRLRDVWDDDEVAALTRWSRLQELDVSLNVDLGSSAATMTIPWYVSVVPAWTNLQILRISQTLLEWHLDDNLGQWTNLTVLEAAGCALSGTLPSTFSRKLELLDLASPTNDGIEGTLPTEVGLLSRLDVLVLDGNSLDSTLPTELGGLTSLTTFNAKFNNRLHGTIPTELGNMKKLQVLFLGDTALSGTIPSELAQCTDLEQLRIDSTETWGTIPDELCQREWNDFRADCPDPAYATTNLPSNQKVVECPCCTLCYGT